MPKQWTDEERLAFGKKMKALKAKKLEEEKVIMTGPYTPEEVAQAAKDGKVELHKPVEEIKENTGVTLTQEQFDAIMAKLAEVDVLKAQNLQGLAAPAATLTPRGVVGTQDKYPINKSLYSDPRERLYDEAKLSRFNLRENYSIYWKVEITRYQTAQGLWMQEPRFEMELRRKDLDENGKSMGEYVVQKFVGHEDYDAAVDIATSIGVDIDPAFGKDFIDEMRYQQIRMWLEELFFPPKTIQQVNGNKSERVVGGRVVTFYENPKDLNRDLQGV
jgi:hypothetical protein